MNSDGSFNGIAEVPSIMELKPWAGLEKRGLSLARQQQIIAKLREHFISNNLGWIVFSGKSGIAKTVMMEAYRKAVLSRNPLGKSPFAVAPPLYNLTEWLQNRTEQKCGREFNKSMAQISATTIRNIREDGSFYHKNLRSLHFFLDEFDSAVTQSNLEEIQMLLDVAYKHRSWVQMVIGMNKSELEFEALYHNNIFRRVFDEADNLIIEPCQATAVVTV